jgi:uncharacterized membrane protein SpoIIM required for sporulation
MNLESWLRQRRPVWKRLEEIVDKIVRGGPRRAGGSNIAELIEVYQSACADLARLRAIGAEPALVEPLNRLIIRAHGQIYRGSAASPWGLGRFFLRDYPRLFRRTWKFTFASLLVSLAAAFAGYWTVQDNPQIVADIMGGNDREFFGNKTIADIRERFGHESNPLMSSVIISNNVRVALLAFALGVTFGVGTVGALVLNGAMVGGITGAFAKSGLAWKMWMVLLPHGALELSAIVIAGGAGLYVGYGLWAPGQRTRRRALREDAITAMQLAAGLIPAFIFAGLIEGLVTPSDAIPEPVKVGLGITAAVAYWLYLLLTGRGEKYSVPSA